MKYYDIKDNIINGFYIKEIHIETIFNLIEDIGLDNNPIIREERKPGFYEITDEEWKNLIKLQSQGYSLCVNIDGSPNPKKLMTGEHWNGLEIVSDGQIILDSEKEKARQQRNKEFEALDLYDKAVLREDMEENAEMKAERDIFRSAWLSLPNSYSDISVEIETLYPDMPEAIKYFV